MNGREFGGKSGLRGRCRRKPEKSGDLLVKVTPRGSNHTAFVFDTYGGL